MPQPATGKIMIRDMVARRYTRTERMLLQVTHPKVLPYCQPKLTKLWLHHTFPQQSILHPLQHRYPRLIIRLRSGERLGENGGLFFLVLMTLMSMDSVSGSKLSWDGTLTIQL